MTEITTENVIAVLAVLSHAIVLLFMLPLKCCEYAYLEKYVTYNYKKGNKNVCYFYLI